MSREVYFSAWCLVSKYYRTEILNWSSGTGRTIVTTSSFSIFT